MTHDKTVKSRKTVQKRTHPSTQFDFWIRKKGLIKLISQKHENDKLEIDRVEALVDVNLI